ncbi:MAG: hypothetical protein COZ50_01075 [Zetaproteobacteria bacterium CG_4_10_14_3_um_filter_54_28]|nr:MAG: hypothetical protein COZ50_01075 [Zetaproteobacteria bacterium CG_4_10_14_3_um_filter_54_28]
MLDTQSTRNQILGGLALMTKSTYVLFAGVCPLRTIDTDFSAIADLKDLLLWKHCSMGVCYDPSPLSKIMKNDSAEVERVSALSVLLD